MKRFLAVFLSCCLILTGCKTLISQNDAENVTADNQVTTEIGQALEPDIEFDNLDDPELLSYYENALYTKLIDEIDNDQYFIENISLKYISKEYLEEIAYNSQENIYFGYKLSDIETAFEGTKYVFSVDENGQTIVKEFEKYDDTFDQVLKNVAIGTGVILICVTVSTVTAGVAPAVSTVFAVSAKTGMEFALSSACMSGVATAIITGIQTEDPYETLKATAIASSENFKWGAITGVITGGVSESHAIHKNIVALRGEQLKEGLTVKEAALIQRESKYPLDVIKQFNSREEYELYKKAGLTAKVVSNKASLVQKIDLEYVDPNTNMTNLELMRAGKAPIEPATGARYELHHIGQNQDSTLAILTQAQHDSKYIHTSTGPSKIDRPAFNRQRAKYWESYAELFANGL